MTVHCHFARALQKSYQNLEGQILRLDPAAGLPQFARPRIQLEDPESDAGILIGFPHHTSEVTAAPRLRGDN